MKFYYFILCIYNTAIYGKLQKAVGIELNCQIFNFAGEKKIFLEWYCNWSFKETLKEIQCHLKLQRHTCSTPIRAVLTSGKWPADQEISWRDVAGRCSASLSVENVQQTAEVNGTQQVGRRAVQPFGNLDFEKNCRLWSINSYVGSVGQVWWVVDRM